MQGCKLHNLNYPFMRRQKSVQESSANIYILMYSSKHKNCIRLYYIKHESLCRASSFYDFIKCLNATQPIFCSKTELRYLCTEIAKSFNTVLIQSNIQNALHLRCILNVFKTSLGVTQRHWR